MEQARLWIELITEEKVPEFMSGLKSGVVLCKLINKIKPKAVKKINTMSAPFKERENIEKYLKACKKLGMKETDLFTTMDLYESKNIVSVIDNIYALGARARTIETFTGPHLGVKHSIENKREWSEEQLRANWGTKMTLGSYGIMDEGPKNSLDKIVKDPTKVNNTEGKDIQEGLDKDIQARLAAKIDHVKMEQARVWIEIITGEELPEFMSGLKSGVVLCKLINQIQPQTVKKINKMSTPFKERENIEQYLKGCRKLGVKEVDLFVTRDLYECKNTVAVIDNIFSIGAIASTFESFKGPHLGVKHSIEQKKEWSEQQLRSNWGTKQTLGSYGITESGGQKRMGKIIKDPQRFKEAQCGGSKN
eukprot:CAMPEP_0167750472 /NCGR_PEP_ID=MMETSP0110_2-20121227/6014_1 /TAXON_ID=629695 /ORGANISM="Gymnochlora sp., Strain CCMP2014" /LENGTH=362 /DNA_ID=CAMNT_0007635805 /DNA_START=75 /DNA_END=1163 /DNA_ORIENTATION=-